MAHIYMTFDFGTDEERAQQARHKLDGWKQAFRLDKKLIYKFERAATPEGDGAGETEAAGAKKEAAKAEKPAKGGKAGKAGSAKAKAAKESKEEKSEAAVAPGPVKLHLRLAFSGHEKMTEERWLKRIPTEEPFKDAEPETVKTGEAGFAEMEGKFEGLEG